MTDKLLLHDSTKARVGQILKSPPHALLIHGLPGSGKKSLAESIAAELLGTSVPKISRHPYFLSLVKQSDKQEISISSVREVIKKLSLRVPGSGDSIRRVVVIDGAEYLSAEAQNALLKAIEEPPAGTTFILNAASDTAVLPTIASRTEKLAVLPISLSEAMRYYGDSHDHRSVDSAWRLSGGIAGLLGAILKEDDNHPLKQAVESAKRLLALNKYDRILYLDSLSSDKVQMQSVLDALGRILSALQRAALKNGGKGSNQLITARKLVISASKSLDNNASPRLVALKLAQQLPI